MAFRRALTIFLLLSITVSPAAARELPSPLPPISLWAWERPEDLRFLNPADTGIAYLAGTIRLVGEQVKMVHRLQPLAARDETFMLPVARIEVDADVPPVLSERQRAILEETVLSLALLPGSPGVQVDFDARRSERSFYVKLLGDLRQRMPSEKILSITALASWCLGDPWIKDLPVDEAVPMLFRMGADDSHVRRLLARGDDFSAPVCRKSVGISTDEPVLPVPRGRRVYLFHPRSWSKADYRNILDSLSGTSR